MYGITRTHAISIINQLKGLIYTYIFIYDNKGKLLASSNTPVDKKYLGLGEKVAKTNRILVVDEEEMNHKCLVIPINVDEKLVGIIGLSGDFENVSQYGEIIVRVTELLIRESIFYEHKMKSREHNRLLMAKLLSGSENYHSIELSAKLLGWQVHVFDSLLKIDIKDLDRKEIIFENIIDGIESYLGSQELVSNYEGNVIVLLQVKEDVDFKEYIQGLKSFLESKYLIELRIGVSNKIEGPEGIKIAYEQVSKLMTIIPHNSTEGVYYFTDFIMDLVFMEISPELRESFIKEIFKNLEVQEIKNMSHDLEVYLHHNGSINRTSEDLFIHKNTLQYRLNRIKEKTGYNPRNLNDLYKLCTALRFYKL